MNKLTIDFNTWRHKHTVIDTFLWLYIGCPNNGKIQYVIIENVRSLGDSVYCTQ